MFGYDLEVKPIKVLSKLSNSIHGHEAFSLGKHMFPLCHCKCLLENAITRSSSLCFWVSTALSPEALASVRRLNGFYTTSLNIG